MLHQIATLGPYASHVLIPVVPGNHDESFRQQTMPITDSWAIEGASAVADALAMTGQHEHVQFVFPADEEGVITVDVGGLTLGFTHGHLFGATPNNAIRWWQQQSHGRQLVGQADILVSAHWHHLRIEHNGGHRMWIQIPALDGGSDWFRRIKGEDIPAGMLAVWLTPGEGAGWRDLIVHQ
jgi:predicted phosphodiesterase